MERFKKFSAVYAIMAGLCIPALWIYFLAAGIIPRLHSETTASVFLVVSEFVTAMLLLVSGVGIITRQMWAQKLWLISMGMLLYAVLMASGQFLQINHPLFGPVFIVLTAATACTALLSILIKER